MANDGEHKNILQKLHIQTEGPHESHEFQEEVYHEHKGILGKVMEHVTPKETHSDAPPKNDHGGHSA